MSRGNSNESLSAKDVINQNSNCFIASVDVESLFTNVPLDETIKICIDQLFKFEMTVSGLNNSITKYK